MTQKKTLYELLQLQPDAQDADIQAAYDRLMQAPPSASPGATHEDRQLHERVLRVAYSTLMNPQSRAAYDAELAARRLPAHGLSLVPVEPAAGLAPPTALRTDAMLLRAEAIALRANALELKASALDAGVPGAAGAAVMPDAISGARLGAMSGAQPFSPPPPRYPPPVARYAAAPAEPPSHLPLLLSWLSGSIKHVLLALGTLVVIGLGVQTFHAPSRTESAEAQEKIYLQEYYQTHGVRPANMAEARMLDEQRRREAEAQRQQQEAKRQRQEAEREQAAQEARDRQAATWALYRAEQANRSLQYAEEQARVNREVEERRRAEAQRSAEEAERRRLERQQYEWRRTLERR